MSLYPHRTNVYLTHGTQNCKPSTDNNINISRFTQLLHGKLKQEVHDNIQNRQIHVTICPLLEPYGDHDGYFYLPFGKGKSEIFTSSVLFDYFEEILGLFWNLFFFIQMTENSYKN